MHVVMFEYAQSCLSFCLYLWVSPECLHGHQERGAGAVPTIFPQPLLLASSFDDALVWQVRCGRHLTNRRPWLLCCLGSCLNQH